MVPSENRRLTVSRSQLAEILACRAAEAVFCRNFSDLDTIRLAFCPASDVHANTTNRALAALVRF